MKRHLLTSIGILILMVSCKQKETQKTEITEQKPTTELKVEPEKKTEEIATPEQYFENDSLLSKLDSDLYKITLHSKLHLKTETKTNTHYKTITDTIK